MGGNSVGGRMKAPVAPVLSVVKSGCRECAGVIGVIDLESMTVVGVDGLRVPCRIAFGEPVIEMTIGRRLVEPVRATR